jgi:hypothetical protein
MAMGTTVFRIRIALIFPPVLKSDHTIRRAAYLKAADSLAPIEPP